MDLCQAYLFVEDLLFLFVGTLLLFKKKLKKIEVNRKSSSTMMTNGLTNLGICSIKYEYIPILIESLVQKAKKCYSLLKQTNI